MIVSRKEYLSTETDIRLPKLPNAYVIEHCSAYVWVGNDDDVCPDILSWKMVQDKTGNGLHNEKNEWWVWRNRKTAEIVKMTQNGHSPKQIAEILNIGVASVYRYRSSSA